MTSEQYEELKTEIARLNARLNDLVNLMYNLESRITKSVVRILSHRGPSASQGTVSETSITLKHGQGNARIGRGEQT